METHTVTAEEILSGNLPKFKGILYIKDPNGLIPKEVEKLKKEIENKLLFLSKLGTQGYIIYSRFYEEHDNSTNHLLSFDELVASLAKKDVEHIVPKMLTDEEISHEKEDNYANGPWVITFKDGTTIESNRKDLSVLQEACRPIIKAMLNA